MRRVKKIACMWMAVCMLMSSMLVNLLPDDSIISVQAAETEGEENETTPKLPIKLDFEDEEVGSGELPTGWTVQPDCDLEAASGSSMQVVEESEGSSNHVVKMSQTAKVDTTNGSRGYYTRYYFEDTDKAVLEYRVKIDKTCNTAGLPGFLYHKNTERQDDENSVLSLMVWSGGVLKYKVPSVKSINSWTDTGIKFTADKWYTVKIVVNTADDVCELYVDEERVSLSEEVKTVDFDMNCVTLGIYKGIESCTFYVDDLKVLNYVEATGVTFEQTGYTVTEGKSIALNPTYTPANANGVKITYTSADEEIATVSTSGVITGVKPGETTITATPNVKGLNPITLTITVEDDGRADIPFVLDFENEKDWETGKLPTGWSLQPLLNTEGINDSSMQVVAESAGSSNHVVKMSQNAAITTAEGKKGSYYTRYYFKDTDNAVLEYRVKVDDKCNYVGIPCLLYNYGRDASDDSYSAMKLMVLSGGKLCYWDASSSKWLETGVKFKANTWHTVKIAINKADGVGKLYVDGEEVDYGYSVQAGTTMMNCVTMGIWQTITSSTFYVDDLKVSNYVEAESVSFTEKEYTIPVGAKYTLNPTFAPEAASVFEMSYSSSDPSVATVNGLGEINTIKEGETIITAKFADGTPIELKVTVKGEVTGKISVEEANLTIPIGAYKVLQADLSLDYDTDKTITYASTDPTVAKVDENGKITAVSEGTTTISVSAAVNPNIKTEVKVDVVKEMNGTISVDTAEIFLPVGGHTFLGAELEWNLSDCDYSVDDNTITYISEDTDVVTVDEYGEIVAVAEGTTKIIVSAAVNSYVQKEIAVKVTEAKVLQTIYVSPDGTGKGNSAAEPTTLKGALEILESVDKDEMTGNIEVILAEGYYYQTETLALNEKHGGNSLYTVVFKAAEGAEVTIGGGIQLPGTDFKACTETGMEGIYVADVPVGTRTRQMFVDNVRATRARSEGSLKDAEFLYAEDGKTCIGLVCDNKELLAYKNPDGLEIVYSGGYWQQSRIGVQEIKEDTDGKVQLILDQPAFEYSLVYHSSLVFQIDRIDYYENALGLLDESGEWYLDETENKLYYMPRSWEDMSKVTVTLPVLDIWDTDEEGEDTGAGGLLTVTGTDYDNMVQNIRFEGITFADVTWMRPSSESGHIAQQNNYIRNGQCYGKADYTADAAVLVERANSISFVDCDFTRIGSVALKMRKGVQNSMIIGNRFYDISGNAIQIGEPDHVGEESTWNRNPDDLRQLMKNCDILNNYIHDIGVDFHSSTAIGVGFAADMDICHNEIFNIPYSGLHIGFGWSRVFENVLRNMNVSDNFIHDYLQELADGGAIYLNGNTDGNNSISGNYTRNQGARLAALYFDNGSTDWSAWNNVLDTTETIFDRFKQTKIYWTYVNNPANNISIRNNYATAGYSMSSTSDQLTDIVIENNTKVTDLNWPKEALQIIANAGLQKAYAGLRNNQAERISTNVSADEPIALSSDETFQLKVTATDGKDNPINVSGAVYYESADEKIASVSDTGLITGVAAGETVIYISVISNSILSVKEVEVVVGDDLKEIALENISGDIALYTVSGSKTTLQAYGLTVSGKEVSLTDVTYKIDDSKIATVSKNGILKPAAVGETTLTVTGTYKEKQTKSSTYKVTVSKLAAEVSYLDEIFAAENQEKWLDSWNLTGVSTTWNNVDDVSIVTELNGGRTYSGCTYGNELLTFYLGIEREKDWPSIYIRTQEPNKAVGVGGTGYIICFTDNGMQLQRFNGGTRTVIYGTVSGFEAIVAPNVYPYALQDGQLHKVQVGAVNEDGGVRLIMFVDGEKIFDYLDTADSAIKEAGYFGLVGTASAVAADKFTIVRMSKGYTAGISTENAAVEREELVYIPISVSHATDTAFNAAELTVTYDADVLTFSQDDSTLGSATVTVKEAGGTISLADYGKEKEFGENVYVLAFRAAKTSEDTKVTITSAGFVNKENAVKSDLEAAMLYPAEVALTVEEKSLKIEMDSALFKGESSVKYGSDYTFAIADDGAYYEYKDITATMGTETVSVVDNGDGTYTIKEVTGDLKITGSRTAKNYKVSFTGEGAADISGLGNAAEATYGTDYTFKIPAEDERYIYPLGTITIAGKVYKGVSHDIESGNYTIAGGAIKGDIVISVDRIEKEDGRVTVTINGAQGDTSGEPTVKKGDSYTLTLTLEAGYIYKVSATMKQEEVELVEEKNESGKMTYTITKVTGDIVFNIEKSVDTSGVEIVNYLTVDDSATLWLVLDSVAVADEKAPTYDGDTMFWSDKYDAYCYLVFSSESADNVLAAAKSALGIAAIEGNRKNVAYDMDVNETGKVDASDAQLVWNIYNATYSDFTEVTMAKFLEADVNTDQKVDVTDAAAIINAILNK